MKEKNLVSIIIPAYNAEKFLGEALDSVLKQTYADWEAIVVDDGSTDGTAEIAKNYSLKDRRIKYVYQENRRMAAARNKGISIAKGEYVAFLDADNIFWPNKLEAQVWFLESHPNCGISYARIRHFYNGRPGVLYENKNEEPIRGDALRSLLWRNSINVLSVLIRKELFDKYGAFRGEWLACDEHYVWVNLARHGAVFCFQNEIVGFARIHHTSDSSLKTYVFIAAESFLKMLDLLEATFSEEEKRSYGGDIKRLRSRRKNMFFIGKLVKHPLFSWFLRPLFLWRRERNYVLVAR